MSGPVTLRLEPLGQALTLEPGSALRDALFPRGVEFPCGGRGLCRRCRVRVLEGALPIGDEDRRAFSAAELEAGWRLACHARVEGDLTLEVGQWETPILADDTPFAFVPAEGLGLAVDAGTTTLVAQLVDLENGRVLGVRSALNPQAVFGADVMSRVEHALAPEGLRRLRDAIRAEIGRMAEQLAAGASRAVTRVVLVGNTVMHHLFAGLDVEPLARVPFQTQQDGMQMFQCRELGWRLPGDPAVAFLPCIGGFVGSDVLAGVLATRLLEGDELAGLMDLGTNGEIVFGSRTGALCASTAAGPAFEGGRIRWGMRAATGAISEVVLCDGRVQCRVLGNAPPRGICGSGLVDAAAVALELGLLDQRGRLRACGDAWQLCPPVAITQRDIRELQLAKAAIAAGVRILLRELGAQPCRVRRLYLAGAFGNYVNRASARRIGLLAFEEERVVPAGNTALLGAKMALFVAARDAEAFDRLRRRIRHLPLAADPEFEEIFAREMLFPTG
ncbi:MAG: ASKHA domain-containing protein [Bryobacteraceae bacterium]|nr:ASKHA domain-containing protein [Bryobacteraceae bacterium]